MGRQCQRVLDLLGGTCKICKLLRFFISWAILRVLLVAGTSSEWDGTTRRFREYFSGGVFSLMLGWGCSVCVIVRRLLDVTSSRSLSCRSLSSSTNESGCLRFCCHHPVMLLQHSTSGI